jgi:P-type Ca2+ transporter type 2C
MRTAPANPAPPRKDAWHCRPAEVVLAELRSTASGLTGAEAARRLAADGANELVEAKRISPVQIVLAQFKSLIVWILIGAGVLSGILGERMDAAAILAIVVLNALVGFYQEFKAERSIAALKSRTAPQARVRRDGRVTEIPAAQLVVGDVLVMEAGDIVAADARILDASSLRCVESALTGESESVTKQQGALEGVDLPLGDRSNLVFMGTSVAAGTGQAVVVSTAMNTELGRIAGLLQVAGADEETPLQKKLDSVGRILVWASLGVVTLLFVLGLLRGVRLLELILGSVSLAVAAVPEGLPAIVTVALSLGVLRMARRHALVRKLAAVETLGSTSVICTDKTGTLTVGEMTAQRLYVAGQIYEVTGQGYGPEGEVRIGEVKTDEAHAGPLLELATVLLGANQAHLEYRDGSWKTLGDPTEGALLVAGAKAGGDRVRIEQDLPERSKFPFDSDRKLGSVVRSQSGGLLRGFTNGAPGAVLKRCTHLYTGGEVRAMTDTDREQILAQTASMARQALRVLASARRDLPDSGVLTADAVEQDMVFVGLTGIHDPPRPEARDAITRCRAAGIRVVMITGDHPATASAIAQDLGIGKGSETVTGAQLDAMQDPELHRRIGSIGVFARVTAAHKLRIVRSLRERGDVVAMTGDGVNDAPAIQGADIGIAMGRTGTEVTKQAADLIITDDNFATIVAAVEEGRGIYDNIRKTLQYLLAGNTGELLLMTLCVVAGLPAPLLPIHLLWINLVTDGLPALCLATDPIGSDVMKRHPRHRAQHLMDPAFVRTMFLTGALTAGVAFAVYIYVLRTQTPAAARGCAFAVLVFAELLRSFGARSETKPIWKIPLLTNPHLVLVVAMSIGLQLLSQHNETLGRILKTSSMPFLDGLLLLAIGAIPLVVLEVIKVVRHRRAQKG